MICAPLLLGLSLPQGPAPVSRVELLPLQHLCTTRPAAEAPAWGTMLVRDLGSRRDLLGIAEDSRPFEPERVLELISSLHRAEIEGGQLQLSTMAHGLLAVGDENRVASVQKELASLTSVLMRPLQIEVCAWDATDREAASAVLGPQEYAQFTSNHVLLWRTFATTRSDGAVSLDRERWTRYVRDFSVEVAKKVSITRPDSESFGEGGRVVVRPHLLVGGDDVVLEAQFCVAQRRGVLRSVQSGMPGAPDLEVPLLETAFGLCSGRVVNGGALAVSVRGNPGGGGQLALTIRVTSRVPPAAAPDGTAVFPCSALTPRTWQHPAMSPLGRPTTGEESTGGNLEAETLLQLVRSPLGDTTNAELTIDGGHLFVRGETNEIAVVETILRGLQDRLLRTVTVRHAATLAPSDNEAAGGASKPTLHEIVVPTLLGREVCVARMLETNVVDRLEVEIAEEASILDPAVEPLQVGAWLSARVAPLGGGLHVLLRGHCAHGALPQARSVMPAGGILMQTDVASRTVSYDGPAATGQTIEHGDGPAVVVDARSHRSSLFTTIAQ